MGRRCGPAPQPESERRSLKSRCWPGPRRIPVITKRRSNTKGQATICLTPILHQWIRREAPGEVRSKIGEADIHVTQHRDAASKKHLATAAICLKEWRAYLVRNQQKHSHGGAGAAPVPASCSVESSGCATPLRLLYKRLDDCRCDIRERSHTRDDVLTGSAECQRRNRIERVAAGR